MTEPRGRFPVAALLSFNGGFVDTVGFLGLSGLFVAHVTGNFVTLGAALVLGCPGILNKILALPEFITVIALARLLGGVARRRGWPALRIMLMIEFVLLVAFFGLGEICGPLSSADWLMALLSGFAGIGAIATLLADRMLMSRHQRGRRRCSRSHAHLRDSAADLESPADQVISTACK